MSNSHTTSDQKSKLELRSSLNLPTEFNFWNGDVYSGEYVIRKEKQKFTKEGDGVYKTSDGHTYEGIWNNDTLVNNCKITYPDRSVFTGDLKEMVMQGRGQYLFKENVSIECNFSNNRPEGTIFLKDPEQHMWKGFLKEGDSIVYFRLIHPFWTSLYGQTTPNESLFYGETEEEITWEDDKYLSHKQ